MELNNNSVITYSYESNEFTELPAAELAPGMIYVRLPDGERAWVQLEEYTARLPQDIYNLPPAFIAKAKPVLFTFRDELPCTVATLLEQFSREMDPYSELQVWDRMRNVWMTSLENFHFTREAGAELFRLILQMSFSEEGHVAQVFEPVHLSKEVFPPICQLDRDILNPFEDIQNSMSYESSLGIPRLFVMGAVK